MIFSRLADAAKLMLIIHVMIELLFFVNKYKEGGYLKNVSAETERYNKKKILMDTT